MPGQIWPLEIRYGNPELQQPTYSKKSNVFERRRWEKGGGGRQKWNLNYRAPSLVLKFCASAASTWWHARARAHTHTHTLTHSHTHTLSHTHSHTHTHTYTHSLSHTHMLKSFVFGLTLFSSHSKIIIKMMHLKIIKNIPLLFRINMQKIENIHSYYSPKIINKFQLIYYN